MGGLAYVLFLHNALDVLYLSTRRTRCPTLVVDKAQGKSLIAVELSCLYRQVQRKKDSDNAASRRGSVTQADYAGLKGSGNNREACDRLPRGRYRTWVLDAVGSNPPPTILTFSAPVEESMVGWWCCAGCPRMPASWRAAPANALSIAAQTSCLSTAWVLAVLKAPPELLRQPRPQLAQHPAALVKV
jgi:hypothetical protein